MMILWYFTPFYVHKRFAMQFLQICCIVLPIADVAVDERTVEP